MSEADKSPWRQAMREQVSKELPPAPAALQSLLSQALDATQPVFIRARAMATLLVRLEGWYGDFTSKASDLGVLYGFNSGSLLENARQGESLPPDAVSIIEPGENGPSMRMATDNEREQARTTIDEWQDHDGRQ